MIRFIILSAFAVVALTAAARAQTGPATQPTSGLEAREWAIFVLDASGDKINSNGFVQSTLPSFINNRRQTATKSLDQPCPIGVIRLFGAASSKVDVKIEKTAGDFLASWPTAQTRSNQLLWQDITVAKDPGTHSMEKTGGSNWFDRLRQPDSDYLITDQDAVERFLLYDIEMPYTCPLKAKSQSDGAVELNNTGQSPLHDLAFYRTDHGTLMQAMVGDLPVASSTAPTTKPTTTTSGKVATSAPAAQTVAHLAAASTTQPTELAGSWKKVLSSRGIPAADVDAAVDVIAQYAVSSHSLTAVYRMDDVEFDRLLPLEIVPEPEKVLRTGLVIIRNVDPSAGNEIDDLITQLGDPSWSKREAAYEALKTLGSSASARLQIAKKNKDVEIAWRAERLLAAKDAQR